MSRGLRPKASEDEMALSDRAGGEGERTSTDESTGARGTAQGTRGAAQGTRGTTQGARDTAQVIGRWRGVRVVKQSGREWSRG